MKNEIVFTLSLLVFYIKKSPRYTQVDFGKKLGQLNVIHDMFLEYEVSK